MRPTRRTVLSAAPPSGSSPCSAAADGRRSPSWTRTPRCSSCSGRPERRRRHRPAGPRGRVPAAAPQRAPGHVPRCVLDGGTAAEARRVLRRRRGPGHLLHLRFLGQPARTLRTDLDVTAVVPTRRCGGRSSPRPPATPPAHRSAHDRVSRRRRQRLAVLQHHGLRPGRRGAPHARLELAGLPHRGQGPQPGDEHLRVRLLGLGQRGDDLAAVAAPVAERAGRSSTGPPAGRPSSPTPAWRALEFLRAMAVDDRSVYLDQTDTKFAQLFASDRVAMMTSGPWELSALKTAGTAYGVVPLPGTGGNHETVSGRTCGRCSTTATSTARALGDGVRAVADVGRAGRAVQRRRREPAPAVQRGHQPRLPRQARELPGLDVIQANAANARTSRPTVPGYTGLSEAVGNAVAHVLQGQGSARTACRTPPRRPTELCDKVRSPR